MFIQISLSLESNNYLLKLKLNDNGINYLFDKNDEVERFKEKISEDKAEKDEYRGELFGLAFSQDDGITHEYMLKKVSKVQKFFESKGLDVYDLKVVTLATRLKQLEQIDDVNHRLINTIFKK